MSLDELTGRGWLEAQPPSLDSPESVIAVVEGEEITGPRHFGKTISDTGTEIHKRYTTGPYRVELKMQLPDGEIPTETKVRIEKQ